jgi:hypothetical protein
VSRQGTTAIENRRLLVALLAASLLHLALLVLPRWRANPPALPSPVQPLSLRLEAPAAGVPEEATPEPAAMAAPEAGPPPAVLARDPPPPVEPESPEVLPPAPVLMPPAGMRRPLFRPDGSLWVEGLGEVRAPTAGDEVPRRQYRELLELYPQPVVVYRPTRFDEAYAPYGNAAQVASFYYPAINVVHLFPQIGWLFIPPPFAPPCPSEFACDELAERPRERLERRLSGR